MSPGRAEYAWMLEFAKQSFLRFISPVVYLSGLFENIVFSGAVELSDGSKIQKDNKTIENDARRPNFSSNLDIMLLCVKDNLVDVRRNKFLLHQ